MASLKCNYNFDKGASSGSHLVGFRIKQTGKKRKFRYKAEITFADSEDGTEFRTHRKKFKNRCAALDFVQTGINHYKPTDFPNFIRESK